MINDKIKQVLIIISVSILSVFLLLSFYYKYYFFQVLIIFSIYCLIIILSDRLIKIIASKDSFEISFGELVNQVQKLGEEKGINRLSESLDKLDVKKGNDETIKILLETLYESTFEEIVTNSNLAKNIKMIRPIIKSKQLGPALKEIISEK